MVVEDEGEFTGIDEGLVVDPSELVVGFCGEQLTLPLGSSLTFGRSADLQIDDNPYLHRILGRFVYRQGLWWLQNFAKRTTLELRDRLGPSRLVVAPGHQVTLTYVDFLILFSAGRTSYELEVSRSGGNLKVPEYPESDPGHGTTIPIPDLQLTAEQHLMLVALAELRLRDGTLELPSNQAGAERLGWTLTKFNRKLDHLCIKIERVYKIDLHGPRRREKLVEFAIAIGLVAIDDLGLLSAYPAKAG